MKVRHGITADAPEISGFLQELAQLGQRSLPCDVDYIRNHYIDHPDTIQCSVAVDDQGELIGMQILKRADIGNPYGVPVGWGIIGTHIKPSAARRGVGKALFQATHDEARRARLEKIDATIGADNAGALAFYDALGFRSYRTCAGRVCKCFEVV